MSISKGIFGAGSNFEDRNITDYAQLQELAAHWKALGLRIVLTSGSWDMIHEGHALYLEKARSYGDLLIVGVDSDAKIRERKGPERPIVPQQERLRMLTHLRAVDIVVLKDINQPKWALIKAIRPDVLVATEETYTPDQISELEELYCKEVKVHSPMGTTSTSARLRLVQIGLATKLTNKLAEELPGIIQEIITGAVTPEKRRSWQKK
jgi:D-beta-D-heptose 7-phosphate kinase/D-beta-D-heptose 1-phosphate adenosyltransferase